MLIQNFSWKRYPASMPSWTRAIRLFKNIFTVSSGCSNGRKEKQADEGKEWNVEEILKHCTLEDNVLKLPAVQFNRKSYAEAKKWIEEAGGSWQGGKMQGFTFPFNPKRVFSILKEGKRCNLQQEYQFLRLRLRWQTGW